MDFITGEEKKELDYVPVDKEFEGQKTNEKGTTEKAIEFEHSSYVHIERTLLCGAYGKV